MILGQSILHRNTDTQTNTQQDTKTDTQTDTQANSIVTMINRNYIISYMCNFPKPVIQHILSIYVTLSYNSFAMGTLTALTLLFAIFRFSEVSHNNYFLTNRVLHVEYSKIIIPSFTSCTL